MRQGSSWGSDFSFLWSLLTFLEIFSDSTLNCNSSGPFLSSSQCISYWRTRSTHTLSCSSFKGKLRPAPTYLFFNYFKRFYLKSKAGYRGRAHITPQIPTRPKVGADNSMHISYMIGQGSNHLSHCKPSQGSWQQVWNPDTSTSLSC